MFDANMRCLPVGHQFFAKVHHCNLGCGLYKKGIRDNQLLLCRKITDCEESPDVIAIINDEEITINYKDDFFDCLLVYEGNADGSGFINDHSRLRAAQIIDRKKAAT